MPILSKAYAGKDNIGEELTSIQFMECSSAIDKLNQMQNFVCVPWITDDEMDQTV